MSRSSIPSNNARVSVLVPMLNEEKYILSSLLSILNGTYAANLIEIIVIDGGSSDQSLNIVSELQKNYKNIKLINNAKRIQVAALNLGLRYATGEIIVRADAHSIYQSDYIDLIISPILKGEAENAGGAQIPCGDTYITSGIARALASPFGNGNATYRVGRASKYTDTVYLGAWRKSILEEIGGFNELMAVNEDYELNVRLRKRGGRVLYIPQLRTKYFVRKSILHLGKQYFKYGKWKIATLSIHRTSLHPRQALVPIATALIMSSLIAFIISRKKHLMVPSATYALGCVLFSLSPDLKKFNLKYLPITLLAFPVIHFSWSAGFISGIIKSPLPRSREIKGNDRQYSDYPLSR
ncbi:glycosyltransferase family 2 protein [Deinococcus detaillensis]|uniref:Glycosyltransferase family 2 protein n=1 Tax=Deinococcus detaillensis TaxID=2592048 RepID=A0A553UMM1_9DEIO|nr:glycosyltransferase family 2 protein [Deinococcus detaillensis]TSA81468.1 glycosyltransferase family 2 protein [Deinococcus detaillensis]